jgi:hypothetical protein
LGYFRDVSIHGKFDRRKSSTDREKGMNLSMINLILIRTFVNTTVYPHPAQQYRKKKKEKKQESS